MRKIEVSMMQWKRISILTASLFSLSFAAEIQAYRISYRYDLLNRLIAVEYQDIGRVEYTYDASGNRLITSQLVSLKGDVNADGVVNLQDAVLVLQMATGLKSAVHLIGDVNRDSRIDLSEEIYVLQEIAGLR
jgi:YD repeat-containing protein